MARRNQHAENVALCTSFGQLISIITLMDHKSITLRNSVKQIEMCRKRNDRGNYTENRE